MVMAMDTTFLLPLAGYGYYLWQHHLAMDTTIRKLLLAMGTTIPK